MQVREHWSPRQLQLLQGLIRDGWSEFMAEDIVACGLAERLGEIRGLRDQSPAFKAAWDRYINTRGDLAVALLDALIAEVRNRQDGPSSSEATKLFRMLVPRPAWLDDGGPKFGIYSVPAETVAQFSDIYVTEGPAKPRELEVVKDNGDGTLVVRW